MANRSAAGNRLIDRRAVLQVAAALAAAGPALMREGHAEAQPQPRGASPMTIIDAQVHAYAANTPERPWHSVPNWPAHVTGDEMVAAMDKVGVDGAIYISPFSMYQYDGSYAVSVQRAHPDKFAHAADALNGPGRVHNQPHAPVAQNCRPRQAPDVAEQCAERFDDDFLLPNQAIHA